MAILVGVLAPNLLRYIERSKIASDAQLLDTIRIVALTTTLDAEVNGLFTALGSRRGSLDIYVTSFIYGNPPFFTENFGSTETSFGTAFAQGLGYPDLLTLMNPDIGILSAVRQKHKEAYIQININQWDYAEADGVEVIMWLDGVRNISITPAGEVIYY